MTPQASPQPAPAVSADPQTLVDLLTRQRDFYAALGQLSDRQQQIIADGQTEQLLTVLSERQVLIDQLTATNAELAPLRSGMSQVTESAAPAVRQSIRDLVAQVQSMLHDIIQKDEKDRATLEESKARVGRQLSKVRTAPAAIHAYRANGYAHAAAPAAARFTDSRG
jgi:flagellar biosynthesis/type III secretory pathway chaperone